LGLKIDPRPHTFRWAFALKMLHNGSEVFVRERLMGHADLPVRRRYLALSTTDTQLANMRGSPVDNELEGLIGGVPGQRMRPKLGRMIRLNPRANAG